MFSSSSTMSSSSSSKKGTVIPVLVHRIDQPHSTVTMRRDLPDGGSHIVLLCGLQNGFFMKYSVHFGRLSELKFEQLNSFNDAMKQQQQLTVDGYTMMMPYSELMTKLFNLGAFRGFNYNTDIRCDPRPEVFDGNRSVAR